MSISLTSITSATIATTSGAALVDTYNVMAKALMRDTVKRFSDTATGRKRCQALLLDVQAIDTKSKEKAPAAAPAPAGKLKLNLTSSSGPIISAAPAAAPIISAAPAAAPTPAAPAAPAAKKAPAPRRGTNLVPLGHQPEPCREGSKQAALLDMVRRPNGASMAELIEALSGGNKPWTEATVRSGFGWDLKNKGYGIKSEFTADGTERFHLVLPAKFPSIPAHTPLKTAKPKAHAAQKKLA